MTFYEWLTRQKRRDDRVGDLARDAVQERRENRMLHEHTRTANTLEGWMEHLEERGACDAAVHTLEISFHEYQKAQGENQ
jgi:hypothetical protein